MSYTIAAIPTVYRGRKYRSRLEARWAAFFDLLGWQHEYEPFDLGGWSPDFLLTAAFGKTVLVEVKPDVEMRREVAVKIVDACRNLRREDTVLVVNVAPAPEKYDLVRLGTLAEICGTNQPGPEDPWRPAYVSWAPDYDCPSFKADIVSCNGYDVSGHLSGDVGTEFLRGLQNYTAHTMQLWAQASNMAQWKGPGA